MGQYVLDRENKFQMSPKPAGPNPILAMLPVCHATTVPWPLRGTLLISWPGMVAHEIVSM